MPTTSNFGWTTPADTDLVKDGALAIRTLGNGIDTSLIDLKGGTTGQVLSKATNTDLDYTWITPNVGDITEVQAGTGISVASGTGPIPVVTNSMATEITAKGDLIVGTGSGTFDNLPVGTNGRILVADSSVSPTGLKWAVDPVADVITTAGDLIYGTAADTVARLGIGTAGQVLKVNSGATAPEWAAPAAPAFVGCALSKSGTQSVSNTTNTAITFDTEQFDTNTFHDNSTNTSRITIPAGYGGKYLFTAKLTSQGVQAGGSYRNLSLKKNGTVIAYFQNWSSSAGFPASNVDWETQGTQILNLVATDYIEMFWYQDSGATNTIASGTTTTTFQCVYLGA